MRRSYRRYSVSKLATTRRISACGRDRVCVPMASPQEEMQDFSGNYRNRRNARNSQTPHSPLTRDEKVISSILIAGSLRTPETTENSSSLLGREYSHSVICNPTRPYSDSVIDEQGCDCIKLAEPRKRRFIARQGSHSKETALRSSRAWVIMSRHRWHPSLAASSFFGWGIAVSHQVDCLGPAQSAMVIGFIPRM
jgi:hypothetical protein